MDANHHSGVQTKISQHWLDMLEECHVRYIALDPQHDEKLIEQLQTRPEWIVEFADDDGIFFVHADVLAA